jgi:hypothetical protein
MEQVAKNLRRDINLETMGSYPRMAVLFQITTMYCIGGNIKISSY